MPRSGKTTLITVVFDKIISGRLASKISVSGTETIERITAYMHAMLSGMNLGPTTDKDVFSYRYTYEKNFFYFKRKFDVEIADFPGEYSNNFSSSDESGSTQFRLFSKEFYSWVIQADRYIFVVDAAEYFNAENKIEYVKKVEILFKNAVLHLKQELLDEKIHLRPVMLLFSKCDALYLLDRTNIKYLDPEIEKLSTNSEKVNEVAKKITIMEDDFISLIIYLQNNFKSVSCIKHSSFQNIRPFQDCNSAVVDFTTP